jgi:hypothetical protein
MIRKELYQALTNHSRRAQNSGAPLSAIRAAAHSAPRPCADSRSSFTMSSCSSGLIFAAPHLIVPPQSFGRGLNEKNHRPFRFGGGLETFSRWLAVSPVARSALSGRNAGRSRLNRRLRGSPDSVRCASQHILQDITSGRNWESKSEIRQNGAAKGKSISFAKSFWIRTPERRMCM